MTTDSERLEEIRRSSDIEPWRPTEDVQFLLGLVDRLGTAILPMCGKDWMTFCDFCGAKSKREAIDEKNFLAGYRVFIPHETDCVWLFAHNVYGEPDVAGGEGG